MEKKSIRLCLGLVALVGFGVASPAHGAFALSGYLRAQNVLRFVVVDLETGQPSPWLFIGDLFQGFLVMGFDAGQEVLTLERGGTVMRLPLGGPTPSDARAELRLRIEPNGTISMAGQPTTVSAIETLLKDLQASGKAVVLDVRTQPGVASFKTTNSLVTMLRDSGATQWSIRLIDVTAEQSPMGSPGK